MKRARHYHSPQKTQAQTKAEKWEAYETGKNPTFPQSNEHTTSNSKHIS